MTKTSIARGNTTRQANKELRRKRILDHARDLIATKGFDVFTISELASKAEVSVPTVHNLFGKKYDIFRELCEEMVVRIEDVMSRPDIVDPIEGAESFIDNLLALFSKDEAFYRAAFVTGERTRLFEHQLPTGIFQKSLKIANHICASAKDNGFLRGSIATPVLAEQLFGSQRLARQDWVNGYIDINQYRDQVLKGMYITYAADATPEFSLRLVKAIQEL
jgi:AcrR family transcriptional regulator